jgi:hypothetical protein
MRQESILHLRVAFVGSDLFLRPLRLARKSTRHTLARRERPRESVQPTGDHPWYELQESCRAAHLTPGSLLVLTTSTGTAHPRRIPHDQATRLGLTVPQSLMLRADEVFE